MEPHPSFETASERIVAWAAQNPLSVAETEKQYAHLLAGLQPIPASATEWKVVTLGRLVVRYWKDRVNDVSQSLDALTAVPALAFRGAAPVEAGADQILKAEGTTGVACVKLTENADHATVALSLWLEPKAPEAGLPFGVTVFGPGEAVAAGPVECAGRGVVKFASVAPAGEHVIVFKTEAETWRIRWEILAAQP